MNDENVNDCGEKKFIKNKNCLTKKKTLKLGHDSCASNILLKKQSKNAKMFGIQHANINNQTQACLSDV
jgi:hypothetical protein